MKKMLILFLILGPWVVYSVESNEVKSFGQDRENSVINLINVNIKKLMTEKPESLVPILLEMARLKAQRAAVEGETKDQSGIDWEEALNYHLLMTQVEVISDNKLTAPLYSIAIVNEIPLVSFNLAKVTSYNGSAWEFFEALYERMRLNILKYYFGDFWPTIANSKVN